MGFAFGMEVRASPAKDAANDLKSAEHDEVSTKRSQESMATDVPSTRRARSTM